MSFIEPSLCHDAKDETISAEKRKSRSLGKGGHLTYADALKKVRPNEVLTVRRSTSVFTTLAIVRDAEDWSIFHRAHSAVLSSGDSRATLDYFAIRESVLNRQRQ